MLGSERYISDRQLIACLCILLYTQRFGESRTPTAFTGRRSSSKVLTMSFLQEWVTGDSVAMLRSSDRHEQMHKNLLQTVG